MLKTGEMCLALFNIFLSITDIEFLINKGKVMLEKNLFSLLLMYFKFDCKISAKNTCPYSRYLEN